jgi:hypothetical protein
MAAARLARDADEVRARLELLGMQLDPADRVVDIRQRQRIGALLGGAPVERDDDHAVAGQHLVADLVGVAVGHAPGAAMQIDQRRKRPLAARLVHLRQQRPVAVAEILDVLHVELVGPGVNGFRIHGGTRRCCGWLQFRAKDGPEQPTRHHSAAAASVVFRRRSA